jgi:hypothetical protein
MYTTRAVLAFACIVALVGCTPGASGDGAPAASTATPLITDLDLGFSVRYPSEYHVVLHDTTMCFSMTQTNHPPGACHEASAFIEVREAAGLTLEEAVEAAASQGNPEVPVIQTSLVLSGEEAVLLEDIYATDLLSQVVVLHNDRLYELTFVWDHDALPLSTTLTQSFTFLDE